MPGAHPQPADDDVQYISFFRADVNKSKVHSTKLEEDGLVYTGYRNTQDYSDFPPPPIQRRAPGPVVIDLVSSDSEDNEAHSNAAPNSSMPVSLEFFDMDNGQILDSVPSKNALLRQRRVSVVPANGTRRTRRTVGR